VPKSWHPKLAAEALLNSLALFVMKFHFQFTATFLIKLLGIGIVKSGAMTMR